MLIFFVAGKHVGVWTGLCSAGLHRNPLYSARSASFSSLTHANTLTSFISLGLGSDLLKVRSNSSCKSLFYLQCRQRICAWGEKKNIFFFLPYCLCFSWCFDAWVQNMMRICWVCMRLQLGWACLNNFAHGVQPCKQRPKSQGGSFKCAF